MKTFIILIIACIYTYEIRLWSRNNSFTPNSGFELLADGLGLIILTLAILSEKEKKQ